MQKTFQTHKKTTHSLMQFEVKCWHTLRHMHWKIKKFLSLNEFCIH